MGERSPQRTRMALLALLPIAAIGLLYAASRTAPPEEPQPAATGTMPEAAATPEAAGEPAPEAAPEAAEGPAAPGFDVVRVEPDGSAAVVGTAEPGAKVTIYADEAPLAEAEADADGNFVAIFQVDPSPEPRALTLGAVGPAGETASSADVVMLLPRTPVAPAGEAAPGAGEVAAAVPAPPAPEPGGEPVAVEPAPVVLPGAGAATGAATGETTSAATGVAAGEAGPEVAAAVIVRDDGVEVAPPPAGPDGARRVTLGAVSYAEGGEVTLAGAGTAGATVRAYVDDRFAEEVRVAADGRWSMQLDDVAGGIYRLRIDQIAADGKVASRVE
ncbi:MAG TPA: hypothetical protein VFN28_08700, partial [Amaricoccus sp.]|nr:hypothetical protein [Amaricoccus sp.]